MGPYMHGYLQNPTVVVNCTLQYTAVNVSVVIAGVALYFKNICVVF